MVVQGLIMALQQYWASKGCVVMGSYDMMMGAGTFHPYTVFKTIGPDPMWSAFVQVSRRPGDGRYGQNPNRLSRFHQFQVLLKPAPKNSLELYLESLAFLGLNLTEHEVRLVEDDWESPTLGASGLGWEVWCNGMEITQLTYFEQMASLHCKPTTFEITYGIERIAMFLQNKDNFKDLAWNSPDAAFPLTLGQLFGPDEQQFSGYNFEFSDPEVLLRRFEESKLEAERLFKENLWLPGYEECISSSHYFNLLDARGVLSVAERARYIGLIRELAKNAALCFLANKSEDHRILNLVQDSVQGLTIDLGPKMLEEFSYNNWENGEFLLEILCEPLPARMQSAAENQLLGLWQEFSLVENVNFSKLKFLVTARRLVLSCVIDSWAPKSVIKKGPKIVAEGEQKEKFRDKFTNVYEEDGYLWGKEESKASVQQVLCDIAKAILTDFKWPKSMNWYDLKGDFYRWVRPIINIHCSYEGKDLGLRLPGLVSNLFVGSGKNNSFEVVSCTSFSDLETIVPELKNCYERKSYLRESLRKLLHENLQDGLSFDDDEFLWNEVAGMVEDGRLVLTKFAADFLNLPSEILARIMKKHQRFIPFYDQNGKIVPDFAMLISKSSLKDLVIDGGLKVLTARFLDGKFFWEKDLANGIKSYSEELKNRVFFENLGSLYDRKEVLKQISCVGIKDFSIDLFKEVLDFYKADLCSHTVGEFPELQGIVGKYLVKELGLSYLIGEAIEDNYREGRPRNVYGAVLLLLDRSYDIFSLLSIGRKPTGSKDPLAIRRMARRIWDVLFHYRHLAGFFQETVGYFANLTKVEVGQFWEILMERLPAFIKNHYPGDLNVELLKAVLAKGVDDLFVRWEILNDNLDSAMLENIKRIRSFLDKDPLVVANEKAKVDISKYETDLQKALEKLDNIKNSLDELFKSLKDLPIKEFLDNVLVNSENPAERSRKINLLKNIWEFTKYFADFDIILKKEVKK